jgi:hexosaminidase
LSIATVKRTIDGLAAVKINVLHWHLSDDQGFRVESKKYPRLQEYASEGDYYTQAQIRDIVAYGADRGVRIVPEFDMPAHTTSWFAAYPSLASVGGKYEILHRSDHITATMDPSKEATYKFLDGFIGEMSALFPDEYFHIGGDEVNPRGEWFRNRHIKLFMRQNHLKDFHALQAYFNRRVQKILTKYGKKMEGWDEVAHPDLPKDVLIQSWRGKSLTNAVNLGFSGILSAGYYLDLMKPAADHYVVDPLRDVANLSPEQQGRILGGEAAMWGELATDENIDAKLWPRLAAIAERLWSPQNVDGVSVMYARLEDVSGWLERQGIQHRAEIERMQKRLAGESGYPALSSFAGVLEPLKGYARHKAMGNSTLGPFNRLVDSIPPESDAAREFSDAVQRFLEAPTARFTDAEYLRNHLTRWRQNSQAVMPVLQANALLTEDVDLASSLQELCTIGLEAVDHLSAARPADLQVDTQVEMAAVERDAAPRAEMIIQIAPAVRKLVEASAIR